MQYEIIIIFLLFILYLWYSANKQSKEKETLIREITKSIKSWNMDEYNNSIEEYDEPFEQEEEEELIELESVEPKRLLKSLQE